MVQIPEKFRDILDSTAVAHVATIGPHGEPQSNPVWFGWDGTHLLFSQIKTRQKYRNVRHDPRIAISITDLNNASRYLEIRGKVVRIDEDTDRRFVNSMAKKYLGQDTYPWDQPGDERVIIVVEPEHTTHMG